jgi:adiponectin receptor
MLAATDDRELYEVNIHTHLIPFLLWTSNVILTFLGSSISSTSEIVLDTPILAFTVFALFTLFSSVVWHTMAGCAHHRGMVLCAKIDYVGIAWYVYTQPMTAYLCSHIFI